MADRLQNLSPVRPVVDNTGRLTQESRYYFSILTARQMIVGSGSPEGVVQANQGAVYMDDAGTAGNILYVKRNDDTAGDRTQGWILV